MRLARLLTVALVLLSVSCGDSDDSSSASTAPPDTGTNAPVDTTDACSLLSPADFAAVGFTVDAEGEDVSENFTVSTTSSVACQWMSEDDNIGSSWELIIGTGDAEAAYEFEFSFAAIDAITTLAIGDESYLADRVSVIDSSDHDFEAGVRIGDTYFTVSTTDDRGAEAILALAALVADRLSA